MNAKFGDGELTLDFGKADSVSYMAGPQRISIRFRDGQEEAALRRALLDAIAPGLVPAVRTHIDRLKGMEAMGFDTTEWSELDEAIAKFGAAPKVPDAGEVDRLLHDLFDAAWHLCDDSEDRSDTERTIVAPYDRFTVLCDVLERYEEKHGEHGYPKDPV